MEDQVIIQLCLQRSEKAVSYLIEKYKGLVFSTSYRILQDKEDAMECTNDVYMGVWNSIPPNNPEYLPAYICKITRNLSLKKLEKRNSQKRKPDYQLVLEELEELVADANVEQTMLEQELGREINEFLGTVSKNDRILFVNRFVFGYQVKELSELYRMPINQISVRLTRMKAKLKRYLEERGHVL